jgi:hypothetical protein
VYATVLFYVYREYIHWKHEGWQRYNSQISWVQLDVINYILFIVGMCRELFSAIFFVRIFDAFYFFRLVFCLTKALSE